MFNKQIRSKLYLMAIVQFYFTLGISSLIYAADAITVNVADYGAVGDGIKEDGAAIEAAIKHLNSLDANASPTLIFPEGKTYVITGSSNLAKKGMLQGVAEITHPNTTVIANKATFIVPNSYYFQDSTKKTTGETDHFARGLTINAPNCIVRGGLFNGNLKQRKIIRGPKTSDYGGMEMGIQIGPKAHNVKVYDVISKEWGTDSCYVQGHGEFYNCIFDAGRRQGASVITRHEIKPDNPIKFINCKFLNTGIPYGDLWNAPGAGIDIECEGRNQNPVSVYFSKCIFKGNQTNGILLHNKSKNIVVENCIFYDSLKIAQKTMGGHIIRGNTFLDNAKLIVAGYPTHPASIIQANVFDSNDPITSFCWQDCNSFPNNLTINMNAFLKASPENISKIKGSGHILKPNFYNSKSLKIEKKQSVDMAVAMGFQQISMTYIGKDMLFAASSDDDAATAKFEDMLCWDTITIGDGANIKLVQLNQDSTKKQAVYVKNLKVTANSTLDLNGINIYCLKSDISVGAKILEGQGKIIIFKQN